MNMITRFVLPQTVAEVILVSLELSRAKWFLTVIRPDSGEKMSRYFVEGGDLAGVLERLAGFRREVRQHLGRDVPVITIQEAGYEGFWLHRALEAEGVQSYVVDASSIAQPRRARNAKTDRIDGEMLLRVLMAWLRGEPRVCSMVTAPGVEDEDCRHLTRERRDLIGERVRLVNRLKGLLLAQGIRDYDPMRPDRRERFAELRTGDGHALGAHLARQIGRLLDRLELLLAQIKDIETIRKALIKAEATPQADMSAPPKVAPTLMRIKGIGWEFASVLATEGFFRHFANRRQVASYAGLAPTPWCSGSINREQGISRAGNPRLRSAMVEMAWLWLRHQPDSQLTRWFHERTGPKGKRLKKPMIAALARKLLIALWKFVTQGVIPEGVILTPA